MPSPEQVIASNNAVQTKLQQTMASAVDRLWAQMDPNNFDASWSKIKNPVQAVVTAGQRQATSAASSYVAGALDAQGITSRAAAAVNPSSLVGTASSGAPLDGVLDTARIAAKVAVSKGATAEQALAVGGRQLHGITVTQVADANRVATGLEIVTRPNAGYVRHCNPPCCKRCLILAGRFFRANTGFKRHPQCDCKHVPTNEKDSSDVGFDPHAYLETLSPQARDALLGPAAARALDDGADLSRLVNAKRDGMTTASTGGDYRRRVRIQRLMPEQIYEIAGSDRDEALRLLTRHGFIR